MAKLTGQVTSVAANGDLVTDIQLSDAVPRDESVSISCEGHVTSGIFPFDHGQPDMTFVAFEGEDGYLRLSLVGDDASRFLGIKTGSAVTIKS